MEIHVLMVKKACIFSEAVKFGYAHYSNERMYNENIMKNILPSLKMFMAYPQLFRKTFSFNKMLMFIQWIYSQLCC